MMLNVMNHSLAQKYQTKMTGSKMWTENNNNNKSKNKIIN